MNVYPYTYQSIKNGRVPVALITGWNVMASGKEMEDNWVDLIVQKPFEVRNVLSLVHKGMQLRKRFQAA